MQPSSTTRNGTAPGALLYGSTQLTGGPQSASNILDSGNLEWIGINGSAGPVATDPTGSGTEYQYWWPNAGGNGNDFFQNAPTGRCRAGHPRQRQLRVRAVPVPDLLRRGGQHHHRAL